MFATEWQADESEQIYKTTVATAKYCCA